jgi:hypothetical protein
MAKTRSMTRTKKQIYRSRVKSSQCRKKSFTKCRLRNGCKYTIKGKRSAYCRKSKNSHA